MGFLKRKQHEEIWGGPVNNVWKPFVQTNASWAEQMITRSACRLRMVIAIAGTFLSLYTLLLLISAHPCWRSVHCKDPSCISHPVHRQTSESAIVMLDNTTVSRYANKEGGTQRRMGVESPNVVNEDFHRGQALAANSQLSTNLSHIVFGIAASATLWEKRKEYVKLWWRPGKMRGFVWLDRSTRQRGWEKYLPPWRISENTDRFKYTNPQGHRSAIRISRIVSETVRMRLRDVHWLVMGDDDTVFILENLLSVLSKYDHTQYYYIGSNSESHIQNIAFSYNMAYGGGGFAISYPLAKALEKMQDGCLERYPSLFGSDDRIQACMAELGVPLTKELGFHQYDIYGNLFGLMASHPVTPVVSIHHLDVVDPIFPNRSRLEALEHLSKSMKIDPAGFLQQSICYDKTNSWSVSISWGFAVQVFRGIFPPRELEMPSRTFLNWYKKADYMAYAFNTRPVTRHPCQKPILFFMEKVGYGLTRGQTVSNYSREKTQPLECRWRMASPTTIDWIRVVKNIDNSMWSSKAPRRKCCRVLSSNNRRLQIDVGDCADGEFVALNRLIWVFNFIVYFITRKFDCMPGDLPLPLSIDEAVDLIVLRHGDRAE